MPAPTLARPPLGLLEQGERDPRLARMLGDDQVRDPGLLGRVVEARPEVQRAEGHDLPGRVLHDHVVGGRVDHLLPVDPAGVLAGVVGHDGAAQFLEQRGDRIEVVSARRADRGSGREGVHEADILAASRRGNPVALGPGSGTVH